MGDPRKTRRKYSTPSHPWQDARIKEESVIVEAYGLKNKKEIWRANSTLKNFKEQAKTLVNVAGKKAEIAQQQLVQKIQKIGLLGKAGTFDDILSLSPKDILERRLQTIVLRKGLAKSITQARQFVTHGHIMVGGKKLKSPSHLVTVKNEGTVEFIGGSALSNPDHAERIIEKVVEVPVKKKEAEKQEKPVNDKKEKSKKADKPSEETKEKSTEEKKPEVKEEPKKEKAPKEEKKVEESTDEKTPKKEEKPSEKADEPKEKKEEPVEEKK